jgi:hypothetical protein
VPLGASGRSDVTRAQGRPRLALAGRADWAAAPSANVPRGWNVYSAHARVHDRVEERPCRVAAGHGGVLALHTAASGIEGLVEGAWTPVGGLPPGRRRKCAIHVPNRAPLK